MKISSIFVAFLENMNFKIKKDFKILFLFDTNNFKKQ